MRFRKEAIFKALYNTKYNIVAKLLIFSKTLSKTRRNMHKGVRVAACNYAQQPQLGPDTSS